MKPGDVTLLLTRPEPAARRFAAQCVAALGTFREVIVAPLIRIVPLPLPPLAPGAVLAFTSENGVAAAAGLGATGCRAWCVGTRTAAAAREAGFDAIAAGGDAAALAEAIGADPPQGPVLHLSGRHQRGDLVGRLSARGLRAARHAIYDQVAEPLSAQARAALAGPCPVLAPLFSPRSAALLAAEMAEPPRALLLLAHLSPAVAEAWTGPRPAATIVAERPEADAMIAAMGRLLAAGHDA